MSLFVMDVAVWLPDKPVMAIVGQSIGSQEYKRGRPFIGPAGQEARGWLRVVGLDPDVDVMYTNVIMAYKPTQPNYKPTTKEIKLARPRIEGELSLAPTLRTVVLLGGPACHMVFSGTVMEMHGRRGEWAGLPVFACAHPSWVIRSLSPSVRSQRQNMCLAVMAEAAQVARGGTTGSYYLPEVCEVMEVEIT